MGSPCELYQIETTADGSPTLRLKQGSEFGESMHNPQGALAETLYIYRPTIEKALSWGLSSPAVLSVGLGIGYNELLMAALCLRHRQEEWRLLSFESLPFLRHQFLEWLEGASPAPSYKGLHQVYDQVLAGIGQHLDIETPGIKAHLLEKHQSDSWLLRENLDHSSQAPFPCHGILYDAFSSNTSPDLWTQETLESFVERFAATPCALSTYAATGALKRTLAKAGFQVEAVKGFGNKRQSTCATRQFK